MIKNDIVYDVLNNLQNDKKEITYNFNDIYAVMHKGNVRNIQQDSLIYTKHPQDDNVILLALADGMGGLKNGEEASNYAVTLIYHWFINCKLKDLNSDLKLINKVNEIDSLIRKKNSLSGTTLLFAIISPEKTTILSIGDSRAYLLKKDKFIQITKDHTISWELYEKDIIKYKDDIRYHKQNNLLTARLGWEKPLLKYDLKNFDNNYDALFLFSDGITDSISDRDLLKIILMDECEKVTKNIIDTALNISYYRDGFLQPDYNNQIHGGEDNLSVIMYNRKAKL